MFVRRRLVILLWPASKHHPHQGNSNSYNFNQRGGFAVQVNGEKKRNNQGKFVGNRSDGYPNLLRGKTNHIKNRNEQATHNKRPFGPGLLQVFCIKRKRAVNQRTRYNAGNIIKYNSLQHGNAKAFNDFKRQDQVRR